MLHSASMQEHRLTSLGTVRGGTLSAPTLSPPLKWAGGKRWQLQYLRPLWNDHSDRRLVEPFVGGMAVALGLQPARALLNDANPHLINLYSWIREGLEPSLPMRNTRATYDRHRRAFNAAIAAGDIGTREAAELFYYLNRTGFNGLCRFNQSGLYNVPFGSHSTINYARDFAAYAQAFDRWSFQCGDFEKLQIEHEDFIYADPPYDVNFTTYSQGGFSWDDQVRAATWLARHRGPVALSNQATPRIVRLYRQLGFALRFLAAPRMISCSGDRTPAKEVLATKNL